ncbi:MAG: DNA-binding domain-containing protein [Firmicutes bacterium]|nr:DNA-binding domain-containing protein [Bacillota bacterium]
MRYYIVDDNIATIKSLQNIIITRNLGSILGYSTDPEAALTEILEDRPDIVLVDLLMGGMDGITLVEKIRAKNPNISFVMISKVTDKDMVQRAYTAGIEFFINKPVNLVEVETVLKNVSEKIKMKGIMGSIRDMFEDSGREAPKSSTKSRGNDCDILLGMLGMLGEKGVQDIRTIYRMMLEEDAPFDKSFMERAAKEQNDTVKNVEQRIRRAIKKGLSNAAAAGLDDYGSEVFTIYAPYVFDFKTLKDEMSLLEGKSASSGRVNISKFMEGLILYHNAG